MCNNENDTVKSFYKKIHKGKINDNLVEFWQWRAKTKDKMKVCALYIFHTRSFVPISNWNSNHHDDRYHLQPWFHIFILVAMKLIFLVTITTKVLQIPLAHEFQPMTDNNTIDHL